MDRSIVRAALAGHDPLGAAGARPGPIREPELARLEATFYQVLTFGSGAMIIAAAQASFFTGREKTRVVMFVDTAATLLNAALDYVWIFGRFGFPAGGIAGAAWATTTAEWFRVLVYG